jgi:hypothetical protein
MAVYRWLITIPVLVLLLVTGSISCGEQPSPAASLQPPSEPTTISVVSGEVFVMKAGVDTWSKASPGMTLEAGDRIKTGSGSNALITFFEGSTIELEADTEIGVTDLGIAEGTGSTAIKLHQEIGKTTNRVKKLVGPASTYEIETPDGAAVVRGSVGDVIVTEGNSTTIINRQGQWSAIVDGKEIPIPQGYKLTFKRGQLKVVPVPIEAPPVLPQPPTPSSSQSSRPSSRPSSLPPSRWLPQPSPQPSPQWQIWTQTTVRDFAAGSADNVTVVNVGGGDGTVMLIISKGQEVSLCYSSGTLESSSHDCGRAAEFGTISWDALTSGGATLRFQVATNNDNATWNFVGPDGTPSTYYEASGANIWPGHDGKRYIKYKAFLSTYILCQTPELEEVRITYR